VNLVSSLATAALLFAAGVATAPVATAQAPDQFRPIDGDPFDGTLQSITAEGEVQIRLAGGGDERMGLELLQEITLGERGAAATEKLADTLWLRSGLALPAVFASGSDTTGAFSVGFAAERIEVPWRYVQAVRFETEGQADPGFAAAVGEPPASTDLLYARRGDGRLMRISVEFLGLADGEARVRFAGEEQSIALSRVHGLVFGVDSGARPDVTANPRVVLTLRNGRQLSGGVDAMDGTRFSVLLDEGVVLDLATASVARIQVQSDHLVHLTDLTPETEQTAAVDRSWPPLQNQGPGGGPILMGGRSYARGLVLFPRTRLTYRLDGRFDVFETTIGLEQRAGPAAHAVFRIYADDRTVFDSGPVTPRSEPRALKLPVTGVQRLAIEADFGENLDLGDLCVFAVPRLLKR